VGVAAEWGLFLAVCGLGVWLLPASTRCSSPAWPSCAAGVGGTGFVLRCQKGLDQGVLPRPGPPRAARLVVALRLTASEKETRDVGAEKIENQKLLGLSFQEKGMLDMALAQFNKLPFTQEMKSIYLNLGLDYENRGLPQKAYLVYKKIFDADAKYEDVVQRMERLSQAGAGSSFFAVPTGLAGRVTPPPMTAAPRLGRRSAPRGPGADPLSCPPPSLRGRVADRAVARLPRGCRDGASESDRGAPRPLSWRRRAPWPPRRRHRPRPRQPRPRAHFGPAPAVPPARHLRGARLGRYMSSGTSGAGHGDVYLVRDTVMDRKAALKTMRLDADLDPKQAIEGTPALLPRGQDGGEPRPPQHRDDLRRGRGPRHVLHRHGVRRGGYPHAVDEEAALQRGAGQARHLQRGHGLEHAHENGFFHATSSPTTSC